MQEAPRPATTDVLAQEKKEGRNMSQCHARITPGILSTPFIFSLVCIYVPFDLVYILFRLLPDLLVFYVRHAVVSPFSPSRPVQEGSNKFSLIDIDRREHLSTETMDGRGSFLLVLFASFFRSAFVLG